MSNKLEAKAKEMIDATQSGGFRHAKLPHGLEIVLERSGRTCRLAMAREAPVRPSDTEVDVVRRAFGVPESAETTRCEKTRKLVKSGCNLHLNVAEVRWIEVEEPQHR